MTEIKLTRKRERFCHELILCGNASEAYREVYDCEASLPETVWNNAYKLTSDNDVKARLAELEDEARTAAMVTREDYVADLQRMKRLAIRDKQHGAAGSNAERIGKALGFHVDKTLDITPKSDVRKLIDQLTGDNPQLSAALHALVPDEDGVDLTN